VRSSDERSIVAMSASIRRWSSIAAIGESTSATIRIGTVGAASYSPSGARASATTGASRPEIRACGTPTPISSMAVDASASRARPHVPRPTPFRT
jgi:hypothetical protein